MKANGIGALVLALTVSSCLAAEPEDRGIFDEISNALDAMMGGNDGGDDGGVIGALGDASNFGGFTGGDDGGDAGDMDIMPVSTVIANGPDGLDLSTISQNLDGFFSGAANNFNDMIVTLEQSDAPVAQNLQQNMQNSITSVQSLASSDTPPTFDMAHSVFCGMIDALNGFVDSGIGMFTADLFTNTVDTLDLDKFMGRWYQVYAGDFVIASTETDMACIISDYTRRDDASFDISDAWTAAAKQQIGTGRTGVAMEMHPGRMRVQYANDAPCVSHGYYVLRTGPLVDDKYDWAIVSDPFAISVRVLARDPEKFSSEYAQRVLMDFSNSWEGMMHHFVPISQSNCPNRDAEVEAASVPLAPATAVNGGSATPPSPASAPVPVPLPEAAPPAEVDSAATAAAATADQQSNANDDDDSSNTALWIGLGVGLGLLLLLLLLIALCCCRRRQMQKKAAAVAVPAKLIESDSKDKMLSPEKRCSYCQGPTCIYGGQVEHDLAKKLEDVHASQAETV